MTSFQHLTTQFSMDMLLISSQLKSQGSLPLLLLTSLPADISNKGCTKQHFKIFQSLEYYFHINFECVACNFALLGVLVGLIITHAIRTQYTCRKLLNCVSLTTKLNPFLKSC